MTASAVRLAKARVIHRLREENANLADELKNIKP
jgi:hypothetical protein